MAVIAQEGIFGWGPQPDKTTTATSWSQHRAADVDLTTLDDVRLGPPEVGGQPFPTIPYKAGVLVSGGALIQPRLENTFGWLLYGALGDLTTTGPTGTSVYTHTFTPNASSGGYVPWMSFRKYIPGLDGDQAKDLGEIFTGCKIANLTFNLPNDGLITARVDALGRIPSFTMDPVSWSWDNTFETYESIPIGVVTTGYLKIGSTEYPVASATVGIANVPLDIRSERVYGSPYLEDVTIVGRAVTCDLILKWNDANLHQQILTGTSSGTAWGDDPFVSDLDVKCVAPSDLPYDATPYSLRVQVPEMLFQVVGGVRLSGNSAVMVRVTGTGIVPSAGAYSTFTLVNSTASYSWPS